MKSLKYLIILIALTSKIWAQNEAFELANHAYEKENYEQAAIQYQQLIDEGFNNADLYFNLGNTYYKTNQVALSILNFEKALKLDPSNKKFEHNLSLAYLQTKDQLEPLPQLFFVKWWHSFLSQNTDSQWSKKSITFIWIAFIFLVIYLFLKKKWLKYLAGILLFLNVFYFFMAYQKNKFDNNNEMAIVMQNDIELKETPNKNATTITNLPEGLKLQIMDQVDEWSQVKLEDGTSAWVKTISLERI